MVLKTRQQVRAQESDSDPLKGSRQLPPVSTRSDVTKKPAARKSRLKPLDSFGEHNLLIDLPPELWIVIYEYCVAAQCPLAMKENRSMYAKKSRMPNLLTVYRQIHAEVLSIFYNINKFSFPEWHAKYIAR
jgi:hypothetical protein